MATKWYLEVNLSNGKAIAIGDDYVSGSADLTESDYALIREAGKSLLAFIGEPPNKVVEDEQAICTRDPGTCIKCQGLGCDEWCDDFPPAT